MSARDALEKYSRRHAAGLGRPTRQNSKPEFEVKKAAMAWLRTNGFSCQVVESKGVYSIEHGRYTSGQTKAGTSDLFGCGPGGIAVYIELKAPGRRSTLKEHQRQFLIEKIQAGAFAVCADSVECLANAWEEFSHRRKMEPQLAKAFLLRHLPPSKSDTNQGLNLE